MSNIFSSLLFYFPPPTHSSLSISLIFILYITLMLFQSFIFSFILILKIQLKPYFSVTYLTLKKKKKIAPFIPQYFHCYF
ncbi:hypothetical protein CPCDC_4g4070 [Cryptosporidium sp. 43IA8]|nr:hypothetical protein CPCDC_4g4070 [Cryptosporidium sp. 43IA8]